MTVDVLFSKFFSFVSMKKLVRGKMNLIRTKLTKLFLFDKKLIEEQENKMMKIERCNKRR